MFFYIEIIYFSHKCSLDLFEILCKENALLNSLQHRQVLDCIWRNLGMWGDKQKEGLAGEGEKPRQADGVNSRESEVNEGGGGAGGEREHVSDMNLTAWVSLGPASFHLSCVLVMQIEK